MPSELFTYGWFAEAYQWTPDQVRELELDELDWLPIRQAAVYEMHRIESQAQERLAKGRAQRGR